MSRGGAQVHYRFQALILGLGFGLCGVVMVIRWAFLFREVPLWHLPIGAIFAYAGYAIVAQCLPRD